MPLKCSVVMWVKCMSRHSSVIYIKRVSKKYSVLWLLRLTLAVVKREPVVCLHFSDKEASILGHMRVLPTAWVYWRFIFLFFISSKTVRWSNTQKMSPILSLTLSGVVLSHYRQPNIFSNSITSQYMIYTNPLVIKHWCRKSKQKIQFDQMNFIVSTSQALCSSTAGFTVPPNPLLWQWIGQNHLFDAWFNRYRPNREHCGVGFVGAPGFLRHFGLHCLTARVKQTN